MRYLVAIPYVNRPDLLRKALESIRPLWKKSFIIDSSDTGELVSHRRRWPVPITRSVELGPLTFSQSMNFVQGLARSRECEFFFTMHSDAEAEGDTGVRFLEAVTETQGSKRRWGVAFTHYDTFAAFNTRAINDIGPWDSNLPQYFADNDYYRRLKLAGYETIDTGLPVLHHSGASSTFKSDARRALVHTVTFPLHGEYYRRKWGGPPGHEQFTIPFNSDLFRGTGQSGVLNEKRFTKRSCKTLIELWQEALQAAESHCSRLIPGVLAIPGMTSPKVKHLLNNLASGARSYLEVGCLHGATFAAACYGNDISAVAIDNFSQFGGSHERLRSVIDEYCPAAKFLDLDAFSREALERLDKPIDLYFYDGNHSREAHEAALTHFAPVFARDLIYVCDDWNWPDVREGCRAGLRKIRYRVLHSAEIFSTGNDPNGYWNGLGVFVLKAM